MVLYIWTFCILILKIVNIFKFLQTSMDDCPYKNKRVLVFIAALTTIILARFFLIHFIDSILITDGSHTGIDRSFLENLDFRDYFSLAAFLIAFAVIILMVFKHHILGEIFERYKDKTCFILLIALSITTFYAITYLQSGYTIGNMSPQVSAAALLTGELKHGFSFPFWSYYFGCGSPFLQFYPVFGVTLTALLNLNIGNPEFSLKIVLFLSNIFSLVSAFYLMKELTRDDRSALVGSLAYSLNYFLAGIIFSLGTTDHISNCPYAVDLSSCRTYLPTSRRLKRSCSLGIVTGILWLTHIGYSIIRHFIYPGLDFFQARRHLGKEKLPKGSSLTALSLFISVAISSFHIVPAYLESKYAVLVLLVSEGAVFSMARGVDILSLLVYGPFHKFDPNGSYIGYVPLILAAIGFYYSFKNRNPYLRSIVLGLTLTMIFCCGVTFSILPGFNPFVGIKNSYRFVIFIILFQSILAAFGSLYLLRKFGNNGTRSGQTIVYSAILILILIDLLPMSMQSRYSKTAGEYYEAAYTFLGRQKSNARILDTRDLALWIAPRFHLQTPYPLSYEEHSLYGKAQIGLVEKARYILSSGEFNDKDMEFLSATFNTLNVRYVITEKNLPSRFFNNMFSDGRSHVYEYTALSPFPLILENGGKVFDKKLSRMTNFYIGGSNLDLKVEAQQAGNYELPFSYYHYLDILIDGVKEKPASISDLGFPIMKLHKGSNSITLHPYKSPLRRSFEYLSLVVFILSASVIIKEKKS